MLVLLNKINLNEHFLDYLHLKMLLIIILYNLFSQKNYFYIIKIYLLNLLLLILLHLFLFLKYNIPLKPASLVNYSNYVELNYVGIYSKHFEFTCNAADLNNLTNANAFPIYVINILNLSR